MSKICPLPWNHLAVQQNGDYRACCQCVYPPFGKLRTQDSILKIQTHDIDQARNSDQLIEIRKQQLTGHEPAACKLCYDQERLGQTSKRQHMLKEYSIDRIQHSDPSGIIDTAEFPLQYWDLRFGNLCNLACRSCGPNDSSQWYDDFVELNSGQKTEFSFYGSGTYSLKKIYNSYVLKSQDFNYYESEDVWNKLNSTLDNIDRLYLTGGEPLINKSNKRILDLCIEKNIAHKITLEYNSNLTTIPDWLFKTWSKFKRVNIGCSIDAVGDLSHYIRFPSNWAKIKSNLDYLGHTPYRNIQAKIATTISVYNILHYPDILTWLEEQNYLRIKVVPSYHMLEGPPWLNVQVLPVSAKQFIEYRLQKWIAQNPNPFWAKQVSEIIAHMWAKDLSQYLPKLKHHTLILDQTRNQNGREYLPWLFGILDTISDSTGIDQYW